MFQELLIRKVVVIFRQYRPRAWIRIRSGSNNVRPGVELHRGTPTHLGNASQLLLERGICLAISVRAALEMICPGATSVFCAWYSRSSHTALATARLIGSERPRRLRDWCQWRGAGAVMSANCSRITRNSSSAQRVL